MDTLNYTARAVAFRFLDSGNAQLLVVRYKDGSIRLPGGGVEFEDIVKSVWSFSYLITRTHAMKIANKIQAVEKSFKLETLSFHENSPEARLIRYKKMKEVFLCLETELISSSTRLTIKMLIDKAKRITAVRELQEETHASKIGKLIECQSHENNDHERIAFVSTSTVAPNFYDCHAVDDEIKESYWVDLDEVFPLLSSDDILANHQQMVICAIKKAIDRKLFNSELLLNFYEKHAA